MNETTVGIRELKAQISKYLRQVKAGQTLIITDHGKPVGRIVPVEETLEARMQRLVEAGIVMWSGKKLKPRESIAINRGPRQVADLVAEDREIDNLP